MRALRPDSAPPPNGPHVGSPQTTPQRPLGRVPAALVGAREAALWPPGPRPPSSATCGDLPPTAVFFSLSTLSFRGRRVAVVKCSRMSGVTAHPPQARHAARPRRWRPLGSPPRSSARRRADRHALSGPLSSALLLRLLLPALARVIPSPTVAILPHCRLTSRGRGRWEGGDECARPARFERASATRPRLATCEARLKFFENARRRVPRIVGPSLGTLAPRGGVGGGVGLCWRRAGCEQHEETRYGRQVAEEFSSLEPEEEQWSSPPHLS